jgi:hypothetical protein
VTRNSKGVHLAKPLREYIKNNNALAILTIIEKQSAEMWKDPVFAQPFSAVHGQPHSAGIIGQLDLLLEKYMRCKDKLNDGELLVLLGSAWLHDIGYLPLFSSEKYDYEKAAHNHPERAYEFIRKNLSKFGPNKSVSLKISSCVRGHREVPMKDGDYADRSIAINGSNYKVRMQFLTALLRLADELDVGASRATEVSFDLLKNLFIGRKEKYAVPDRTLLWYMRNFYVESLGYNWDNDVLQLCVNCIVPSNEYETYLVFPLILQPIQKAILETIHFLSIEKLILNAQLSHVNTIATCEEVPQDVYIRLQRELLDSQSIRDLIRYEYKRTWKFIEETNLKDSVFKSNIIVVENEVEYVLFNNSEKPRYLAGNGAFLVASQDILYDFETGLEEDFVKRILDFGMGIRWNKKFNKTSLVILNKSALPIKIKDMSIAALRDALAKYGNPKNKTFLLYDIEKRKGMPDKLNTHFLYLEQVSAAQKIKIKYHWQSTSHAWNEVFTSCRYFTKGIKVDFKNFPEDYRFTLFSNLILETGETIGEKRQPYFETKTGNDAKEYKVDDLLAPGSAIIAEWKSSKMQLLHQRK